MVGKRQIAGWINQLEKRMDAVAKERDKLDAVIEEMTELRECCDEAHELLQDARDKLSELV